MTLCYFLLIFCFSYWKELWKLTSHCNGPSHSEIVSKKLNAAQSQLEEGLCFFQPSSSESFAKLTAKHNEFPKVLSFIEKLQQFMVFFYI